MAFTSRSFHLSSFFSLTLLVVLTSSIITTCMCAKPLGFRAKIIHWDSVHSPYYNPKETIADRAERAIESSLGRLAYFQTTNSSSKINNYVAPLLPSDVARVFLANLSIGQPSVVQLVVLDTGSNLLWVQCKLSKKQFEQKGPIFDPSQSSTYSRVSFNSPSCVNAYRGPNDECIYSKKYVDGTTSSGFISKDSLTFETSDRGIAIVSNMTFGCGVTNVVQFNEPSGIFGIGPGPTSFAFQLGSKFSICLGNLNDPRYEYNQVIFGDGAVLEGPSTRLESYDDRYHLTLEGISIEGRQLFNIDPMKVIVDTGSTISYLPKAAFDALSSEVQALATEKDLQRAILPSRPMDLCYEGMASRDTTDFFPVVTLDLAGGVKLVLDTNSLFKQVNIFKFCMAISLQTYSNDMAVIGVHALQYYNIGFDIDKNKAYFERMDCELLDE